MNAITRGTVGSPARAAHDELSELVHDLRSPLAAIEAAARAVLDMAAHEPVVRRLIDLVALEARSAQELVDDALDGRRTHVSFALGDALIPIAERASTRWGTPVAVTGEGRAGQVLGDPAEIARAVANLVDNAFQHGRCSDVQVELELRQAWVVVQVRAGNAQDRNVVNLRSHGLGLRSVQRAARAFGGHYGVAHEGAHRVDEIHLPLALAPGDT
jgi:nitrogen-specific signal transduction histidine kinase